MEKGLVKSLYRLCSLPGCRGEKCVAGGKTNRNVLRYGGHYRKRPDIAFRRSLKTPKNDSRGEKVSKLCNESLDRSQLFIACES
jgi:hypothetical protein